MSRKRLYFNLYNQWPGFVGNYNWRDFNLIRLGFEIEHYMGELEVYLGLLGLNLTITYIYNFTTRDDVIGECNRMKKEYFNSPYDDMPMKGEDEKGKPGLRTWKDESW